MDRDVTDKRSAILAAALDLIAEQGFQSSPMSQVAQRANAGVGTIYRYFSGKDDLINALYLDVKKQMMQSIMRGVSDDMPAVRAFKLAIRNMVGFFVGNPKMLSFSEQYINSPFITDATHEEGMRIAEPMTKWFEAAVAQDLLKPMPVDLLGGLIHNSVVALAKYSLSCGDDNGIEAGIDAIWDMVRQ